MAFPNCCCGECSSILESADPFLPGQGPCCQRVGPLSYLVRGFYFLCARLGGSGTEHSSLGFSGRATRSWLLEELLFRHLVLGAFLLFLCNSRFGLCWFSGSIALLLVRLVGRGFSSITLLFVSVPHHWTFYHALQCLIRVGCHLFTAISRWRGRLSMVVSQLSRRPWQLVCPQALLLPRCPISPPSLSILSYCRCIFLILTVTNLARDFGTLYWSATWDQLF